MAATKTSAKELKTKKADREAAKKAQPERASASAAEKAMRKLNLIDEESIEVTLESNGLSRDGTLEEKADRLDSHYRNTTPEPRKNLVQCADGPPIDGKVTELGCGYYSSALLSECPFCGMAGDVEEPAAHGSETESEDGDIPGTELVTTLDASQIVEVEPDDVRLAKVAELDGKVANVRRLFAQSALNFYDLGSALLEINSHQLYLRRRDDNGSPVYKSFVQFIEGEFEGEFTTQHAYRLMNVAKTFTRAEAEPVGSVAKLQLLVRVSPEAKPRLLTLAATQSVRQLRETVKPDLVDETPEPANASNASNASPKGGKGVGKGVGKGRSAGSVGALAKGRKAAVEKAQQVPESITAVLAAKTFTVPLFVKGSHDRRAHRLADEPQGVCEALNNVKLQFFIELGPQGLGVRVVILRPVA